MSKGQFCNKRRYQKRCIQQLYDLAVWGLYKAIQGSVCAHLAAGKKCCLAYYGYADLLYAIWMSKHCLIKCMLLCRCLLLMVLPPLHESVTCIRTLFSIDQSMGFSSVRR